MSRYLGGLSWFQLAKQAARESMADSVFDQAAEMSFYFLLSLFPLLIFLISMLGMVASGSEIESQLVHWLTQAMPPSASGLVKDVVRQITQSSGSGKLSFGIIFSLWTASSGMAAVINGLDAAFDVKEQRPWILQRITALWLTITMGFYMLLAVVIILFGSRAAGWLGGHAGLSNAAEISWRILQWPLAMFLVVLAFATVYRYAPNKRNQRWKWVTPGAVAGVLLWLAASLGFRIYLMYFNTYTSTYGSLGTVIVLMMWFYVTAVAILLGGEVDSEIEGAVGRDSRQRHIESFPSATGPRTGAA